MFHVVTGGSGSGKSAYAEEQICMLKKKDKFPSSVLYCNHGLMGKRQNKRSCVTDRCEMEKDLRRWNVLQTLRSWFRPSRGFARMRQKRESVYFWNACRI